VYFVHTVTREVVSVFVRFRCAASADTLKRLCRKAENVSK
jgi:hypothetical protein